VAISLVSLGLIHDRGANKIRYSRNNLRNKKNKRRKTDKSLFFFVLASSLWSYSRWILNNALGDQFDSRERFLRLEHDASNQNPFQSERTELRKYSGLTFCLLFTLIFIFL
jgi:hypothetical protein